ncbi:catalase [Nocardioides sp.]|uniref:catalase n=1 Tax=Nocardioides sp. TaxID=35761 RepID=UPI0035629249
MLEPEAAVGRIRAAFGGPEGYRCLHAKGGFYAGTFTATPEAAELCRAGHFSGVEIPVTVRWSNAGGNPEVGDHHPDIRGMAVSFQLPDGTTADLLGQTSPRFPVRTVEEFVALTEASRRLWTLPLHLARHPRLVPVLLASARARAISSHVSYAEPTYHPVHAYRWLDAAGQGAWVRYSFVPHARAGDRLEESFTGPDRLRDEIRARLARGPVDYDLHVRVAGPRDDPHDPTSVWRGARDLVAGRLSVTRAVPDPEFAGAVVVFDPTRVVDGIELSEDPILRHRPAVYGASVSRRARPREK